jgi:formylglycine-generating enzyme required for sulfatase activity
MAWVLPTLRLVLFLAIALRPIAGTAVTIDWVTVGAPGNACDPQSQGCFGAVADTYLIGKYEVTNAQYAEFLNAQAASDPLGLYDTRMAGTFGGITQSGSSGSFTYSTVVGRENKPVNFVSFYDTLRFANWLNNGQGGGDTETGAYTLEGGTATPSDGRTLTRNASATIFLTSEDEWYKAAYYDPLSTSFFDNPAGSDTNMSCATPDATPNTANCASAVGDLTDVGSYTGSASPNGTFDQGGNAREWNEALIGFSERGMRGAVFGSSAISNRAAWRGKFVPTQQQQSIGFRVAMIPEPSTALLRAAGLGTMAIRRRAPAARGSAQ